MAVQGADSQAPVDRMPLSGALRTWSYIGLNSFGGPAGHIAVMHEQLVQRRRWVGEDRFQHALNTCVLLPGPEAMQLAAYLGWLVHGVRGAVVAAACFVMPGFLVMLGLAALYAVGGSIGWVAAMVAGLQAAVVAVVLQAFIRLTRRALSSGLLIGVAAVSFLATAVLSVPFPAIIAAAALVGWVASRSSKLLGPRIQGPDVQGQVRINPGTRRPLMAAMACMVLWLTPVVAIIAVRGPQDVYAQMAWLFSKAAVLTFGGAYAILGYVAEEAVNRYGWLSTADMATGLGFAEMTPGPLVLVLEFVGFMAAYQQPGAVTPMSAGILGAFLAAWTIFVPALMAVFLAAPFSERLRSNVSVAGALAAISAAVCGVILNLALWLATRVLFGATLEAQWGPISASLPELSSLQWPMVLIAGLAALLLFGVRRLPILVVLGICAGLGLLLGLGVSLQA
jgi:chromate transporter